YDLKEGVPWRSIWAVVDLDTGAMIVATPEGYPRREITARTRMTPQPGSKGRLELIAADQSFAEILLVRQGRGAWVLSAAAGGPEDEDGPGNGLLTSRVSRMRAVRSNDPPPEEILPGDIIVIIDPDRMAFSADRVGGQP
ncbi:MAG: hypothetical protein ABI718_14750, partial [Acidobacteriota bacterium]